MHLDSSSYQMSGMDVNFSGLVLVLEVLTGLGIVVHLSQTCSNMVYGWLCVLVLFNTSSQANNSRVRNQANIALLHSKYCRCSYKHYGKCSAKSLVVESRSGHLLLLLHNNEVV